MKMAFLYLAFTFFAFSTHASEPCDGASEALIIATVTAKKTDSLTYCKAFVDEDSLSYYKEHMNCPLRLSEVLEKGIHLPLSNGHDCDARVGDSISGILTQKNDQISLSELLN